jgi:hypothetical protein
MPKELAQLPPAPWHLRGDAVVACRLVPQHVARLLLPADAQIVCVWPGRTIAIAYLSRYTQSPVGAYCECIVAPALARVHGKRAFWISHILVDQEASLQAGRAIWSLPKASGVFAWDITNNTTRVRSTGGELTMEAAFKSGRAHLRLPFAGPAMSRLDCMSRRFLARGVASLAPVRGAIELHGAGGVLEQLGFQQTRTLFALRHLRLTIDAPTIVSIK